MSREKKLVVNTILLSLGEAVPKITGLITLPIYTLMLTKEEYGTYDLINILFSFCMPIITLQIHQGAFRFMLDCRDDSSELTKIITNVYGFILPISAISLIPVLLFVPGSFINRMIIYLYIFFEITVIINRHMIRGIGMNKEYAVGTVINALGSMILAVVFLYVMDMGLAGLLLSLLLTRFLTSVYLIAKGKLLRYLNFRYLSKTCLEDLLRYSVPLIANAILVWVINLSDRFVIVVTLGVEMNAIYAIANKIPQLMDTACSTFNMAWQESASLAIKDADADEFGSRIFTNFFRILVGITALLLAGSPVIFSVLIKGSYEESYQQMPILFMGMFFSCLSGFYGVIYIASKKSSKIAISSFIGSLLNLVINIALIQKIGLFAASLSTLISYAALSLYRTYDTRKIMNIRYRYKEIIPQVFVLVLMCIICSRRSLYSDILNLLIGVTMAFIFNHQLIKQSIRKILRK